MGDTGAPSMEEERVIWMNPKDIKYSQACISSDFRVKLLKRNGEPGGAAAVVGSYAEALSAARPRSLETTLQLLRDGQMKVTEFPPIRVVSHLNLWYSLDNRRLWVFKQFGACIPVKIEEADKEFFQKFSRDNNGDTVTFITPVEAKEYKESRTLLSEVLKWSLREVMNENLYANKVEPIPTRFPSLKKYLEAFTYPLLEETRAQLQDAFEEICAASYIPLLGIEEKKSKSDSEKKHLRTFALLRDEVKPIVNRGKKGKGPWKPKPTDCILLTNELPQNDSAELQRPGVRYTLGILKGSREDDDIVLSATVFAPAESPEYTELRDWKCRWFAVQMGNLATGMRIWGALHRAMPEGNSPWQQPNLPIIAESLYTDPKLDGNISKASNSDNPADQNLEEKIQIDRYCVYRGLNESQATAVKSSVYGLLQGQKPCIRLIQGPPGTGKTATLATLLSILSSMRQRTLVCAPTNVAISEVALRFLKLFDDANTPENRNLQFAQFCDLYGSACESNARGSVQLGDLVLIGNDDRLDVKGPLGKLFLNHRIDRLVEALSPFSGWRGSATSVLEFFRSASSQYETYKGGHEECDAGGVGASFVEFLKKRVDTLVKEFSQNCRVLSTDLPSKFLTANGSAVLRECAALATQAADLVTQSDLKEAEARRWFHESPGELSTDPRSVLFQKAKDKLQDGLTRLTRDLGFMNVPVRPTKEWLQEKCLEHAWLVFSTVSSAGRTIFSRSARGFECVIVDEASQCVEAETVIVTSLGGVKQAVLVGDHKQLPATVLSQAAQGCGYGRSLFERLQSLRHPTNLLNVQYRMHPEISMFPNAQFYDGKVQDGGNVLGYGSKLCQLKLPGPYAFINVHDGSEQRDEDATKSWKNLVEVEIVVHLISKIREVCKEAKVKSLSIGVISPYQSQVENLERRLSRLHTLTDVTVEVKSVDGFQGREKDVIIFSTVRANLAGSIGFLKDHRRLNVAITRAKYYMWIVGNKRTLTCKDAVWKAMIKDAEGRKCVADPGEDPDMTKIIRRVKEELNQLEELLHPNSVLFNGTLWKVLFAKDMKTTITHVKSTQTRQHLLNTMLNLANGRRSPYPTTTELTSKRYSKLIQVQPVADFMLVWTVDVEFGQNPKQVIKVWDAVHESDLAKLVRRLEGGFSTCTDAYLERCTTKQYESSTSKRKLVIPARWKRDYSFVIYKSLERMDRAPSAKVERPGVAHIKAPLEKSGVDDSVLLMKFYSLSSGIARQLLTASDGSQLSLPFEVNEQETAIIQYPRSSFIIGRSGTGKTTVITTKLLQREQEFWIAMNGVSGGVNDEVGKSNSGPKLTSGILRQALITLSPKLCAAVKHNISKTRRSMQEAESGVAKADSGDVDEEMMLDDEAEAKLMGAIPDSFMNIPSDCYPLVITFRKFLTMLDGSVLRSYFSSCDWEPEDDLVATIADEELDVTHEEELCGEHDAAETDPTHKPSPSRVDIDSEDEYDNFSEDEDEENIDEDEDEDRDDLLQNGVENRDGGSGKRWVIERRRVTEVEFEQFASMYWPRFNAKLTKNLDPSLVYTEVMSHIKGSLEALHSRRGMLSRYDYVALATRRASQYSEQQREDIYSLFLQYEKQKATAWEFDVADLVTHLYRQLRNSGFRGQRMHFVYVDEVQDFTQAQIALFRFICDNLEDGFVFAGDTAQTIARGVGFRFEDVRRLYYKEFLGDKECALSLDSKVPDLFQLSMNFRTHMGVVGIADSVVQLLHHFFPNAVDKLDPECSLLEGEVPTFLKMEENRGLVTSLFDMGGAAGGGGCEFGAEQVILVRDSETKRQMADQLGQRGLVLSVHECKGLEFQDVLLYNFFAGSPFQNKWRVIYGFMAKKGSSNVSFPEFDVKRHNLLCSELKQLYVVLTRARQRLWIYDECVAHHEPMLEYWKTSGLVQVKQLDATLAEQLQGKSSAEDWTTRGVKMFNEHHYDAAKLCFDRAGDSTKAQHAEAARLQQAAEKLQGTNLKEATRLFREAAELYIRLQKGDAAAKCYKKIWDFKKAAFAYRDVCKPPKMEDAGDCFFEAKCWQEAACAYAGVNLSKCLSTCWRGKLLDSGVMFIQGWEQQKRARPNPEPLNHPLETSADRNGEFQTTHKEARNLGVLPDTSKADFEAAKTDFLRKAAGHHHQAKNVAAMMNFVRLFPSLAMRRSFLKRRDYNDQLQLIEEEAGNYGKAAELAEAGGNLCRAATLLVQAGSITQAVAKLLHFVRMELLWKDGNKGWPRVLTPTVTQVLEYANSLVGHDDSSTAVILELRILQSVGGAGIDVYRENWVRARELKVVRLQLLSSYLLVHEIAGKMRRSYEGIEPSPIAGAAVFFGLVREQLPDLMEIWDHWSKTMVALIRAIERLEKGRGRDEDEPALECVYSYLGVTKHAQPHSLSVENAKAHWLVENAGADGSTKHAKSGHLSIKEFAPLASHFFAAQLLQIGVSEVFAVLRKFYVGLDALGCMRGPATSTKAAAEGPKFTMSDLARVLLHAFDVLRTVSDAKTWDGETKRQVDAHIHDCAVWLYDAIFISVPMTDSMKEVQAIRETPEALPVFEQLAVNLSQEGAKIPGLAQEVMNFKPMSYDELGRLVTLHPFLGRDWALENAASMIEKILQRNPNDGKGNLWSATRWQHSAVFKFTEITTEMHHCSFWTRKLADYIAALGFIYKEVDFHKPGYLSPLVFLALFERGVVAACAFSTHLKSLIIPQSLALCYMAGKHHEPYYSMLLNCTCTKGCVNLFEQYHRKSDRYVPGPLFDAVKLFSNLLFEVLELEKWFKLSNMDARAHLAGVALRLLKLLITVCINTPSGDIHRKVKGDLTTLFENQSPILADLPLHFFTEMQKIFTTKKAPVSHAYLVTTFSHAMRSLGDPVIVLRNGGHDLAPMSWHLVATRRLRVVRVEVRSRPYLPSKFSLAALGPKPTVKSDANAATNSSLGASNAGVEEESGTAANENCDKANEEDEGVHESELLAEVLENCLPSASKDATEDAWRSDLAKSVADKPVSTIAPCSMTSYREKLEDGTTLKREFTEQLRRLLTAARERILLPLTPLESNQREARSAFLRRKIVDKRYVDLFLSEACPLQVDVYERLVTLNKGLEYIKGGTQKLDNEDELLEKFSDHKEELEEAIGIMNPKNEKHKEMDLTWLQKGIQGLRELLERGHTELQGQLKKLFRAAGEVLAAPEPARHPVGGPESKRKAAPESAQPPPNKGKKAQKHKKKNKKR